MSLVDLTNPEIEKRIIKYAEVKYEDTGCAMPLFEHLSKLNNCVARREVWEYNNDTPIKNINNEIIEAMADTFICMLAYCDESLFDFKDLEDAINKKLEDKYALY